MIKLSRWAKNNDITYISAYNMFKNGNLPVRAIQWENGTILVDDEADITSCSVIEDNTKKSFSIKLDIDLNKGNLSGADQREILDKINELSDLVAIKLGFSVISKIWKP